MRYVLVAVADAEPGNAMIGLDGDSVLEISDSGDVGIRVADDGSEATIDSRNVIFRNNAKGDIVGNVIAVAP